MYSSPERSSTETASVKIKIMEIILEKYEHIVMNCAVQRDNEFSILELHDALCSMGQTKLGRTSVQILLNQLVKKKLLKKRYVRIKYLKFQPLYRSCFDKDFYQGHTEAIDLSNEQHKKVWDKERMRVERLINNPIYRFLHYDIVPCIMEPVYLSEKDRIELKKKIDGL